MATAKQDYVRFLRWLHGLQPSAPEHVRQFANMVCGDFEAIAETAPQKYARAAHLAALARRTLTTTATEMPQGQNEGQVAEWPWTRLHSLAVGPFRGFLREEIFDLHRRVVLFYGPNGSGKSSLCEAIERAMLGAVEEAGLKRIDETAYLSNIHAGRFVEPRLMAMGADRRDTPVRTDPDLYRFCFIEKNRIDAFSRIAQRPQGQRTELIATLFGMEKFNDFCNRFNDQIDPALVIESRKQSDLRQRREFLARDREMMNSEAEKLALHDAEDEAYATAFRPGTAFAHLQVIIGSVEAPGRIAEIDQLLNAVPGTVLGLDRESLDTAFREAVFATDRLFYTERDLQRRASEVSFRALYGAVLALEAENAGQCPACETPLARVVRDPFTKARGGLELLRELAETQELQTRQREELTLASSELHAALTKLSGFIVAKGESTSAAGRYLQGLPVRPVGDTWWSTVYLPEAGDGDGPRVLDLLFELADRASATDKVIRAQLERRSELVSEREDLLSHQRHLDMRKQARQRIIDDATVARRNIAAFDTANEGLIDEAARERLDNLRDAPIRVAYNAFIPYLHRFRNELPGMLIAGLADAARDLYNDFNRGDREEDKLAHLYLPLTGEQRLQLAFRGNPVRRIEALQVLSEGHIRCLGLAILLAKAESIGSPLLIFDDVVNAIDHDHRHGIRETIFTGDRFLATQILVTCHSPEFIKDIRNALPHNLRTDCQEFALTHHDGDHHPRVHRGVPSSAYIDKAHNDLGRFQLRDALANSRRALEMLSNKAWKWLVSYELGELRLTMHGPTTPLSARDLCDAIRLKLRDNTTFHHPSKAPLHDALEEILNASNLTWKYLNDGTHEEEGRDEFDRVEVELVVSRLQRIDVLDLRARR